MPICDWADALHGDGEAFGRIFDRHRARVFRHSYRLAAVTADADNIVSITMGHSAKSSANAIVPSMGFGEADGTSSRCYRNEWKGVDERWQIPLTERSRRQVNRCLSGHDRRDP